MSTKKRTGGLNLATPAMPEPDSQETMPAAVPGEAVLRAIIYPDRKKIGCVLIQAAYGGNTVVPHYFDSRQWATDLGENPRPCEATRTQWEWLAAYWKQKYGLTQT